MTTQQTKDSLIEYYFNYGHNICQIKTVSKQPFIKDELFICAYILFLARYFCICDERQTDIIKNMLLMEVTNKQNQTVSSFTNIIYQAIYVTLNAEERFAVQKVFFPNMFLSPPFSYSEEKEPKFSLAKYDFYVFMNMEEIFTSIFNMSFGADIILLPLTVGILYEFTNDKLKDKKKKEVLDYLIVLLLEGYDKISCRSIAGFISLPNEVIRRKITPSNFV